MRKILLKNLRLSSFKGLKSLEIDFGDNTNISGDNSTGKTTIFDAFLWMLFGKDSTERTQFEIKHISSNGNGSPRDVEVEGVLLFDNQTITLKRVFREKWQKKRGSVDVEFAGNETTYFFNDVPVTMREYQEKVSAICPEDAFKMLTNPYFFNSLKWTAQREILFDIVGGDLPDAQIAKGKPGFEKLLGELTGKSIDEYKRQLANQKRRVKEQLDYIPSRIDEVNRAKPAEEDWKEIANQLKKSERELTDIEDAIADRSQAYEEVFARRVEIQRHLHVAREKLDDIVSKYKHQVMSKYREAESSRNDLLARLKAMEWEIIQKEKRLGILEEQLAQNELKRSHLRETWHEENQRQFTPPDDLNLTCPACKRPFEGEDLDEMKGKLLASFNRDKVQKLESISQDGRSLKSEWERISDEKEVLSDNINRLQNEATSLKERMQKELIRPVIRDEDAPDYREAKEIVDSLDMEYSKPIDRPDIDELKKRKVILRSSVMQLQTTLALKEQIKTADARATELEKQQKELAQQLADHEKAEYSIQLFEKAKSDAIEKKINALFEITQWKLFEIQVNGQEVPTCMATHKNIPYSDLNSAAKANVGLDIINTLSKHYGVSAPIFFDNREGVNRLIDTPSQLINLIVTKDSQLIIKTHQNHGTEQFAKQ